MEIYLAEIDDRENIFDLMCRWCFERGHNIKPEKIYNEIDTYFEKSKLICVKEDGVIIALLSCVEQTFFWDDDKYLVENALFIDKEYRGSMLVKILFGHFEKMARDLNCQKLVVNTSRSFSVDYKKITEKYLKLGYNQFASIFVKDL